MIAIRGRLHKRHWMNLILCIVGISEGFSTSNGLPELYQTKPYTHVAGPLHYLRELHGTVGECWDTSSGAMGTLRHTLLCYLRLMRTTI